jgi:hypothetical protein
MKEALEFVFSSGWVYTGVTFWIFVLSAAVAEIGGKK